MIRRLFVCLLALCVWSGALAASSRTYYWIGLLGDTYFATIGELCTAYAAYQNQVNSSQGVYSCQSASGTSVQVLLTRKTGGTFTIQDYANTQAMCPPTTSGGKPTSVPTGGVCPEPEPENPCAKNDVTNYWVGKFQYTGTSGTLPTNDGTCKVVATTLLRCYADATGAKYCYYQYKKTTSQKDSTTPAGAPAAAAGAAPASTAPLTPTTPTDKPTVSPSLPPDSTSKCPAGTVQAGFDSSGIPICIGMGTSPDSGKSSSTVEKAPTTVTKDDGTTVTTQVSSSSNSDGSTTTKTTTTTTAPDGSVTKDEQVVTGNVPNGGAGKSDSAGQSEMSSFCTENPTLTVCQNSAVSGTCGEISCTGDAIQCATLRAAAAMECREKKDREDIAALPAKALGDSIAAGNDPKAGEIQSALKGTDVDLSKPNLDQSGFIGAASCLPDRTWSVMGKPVVIQFGELCKNIQPLRAVVMACAFLLAYLIVSRSVLQS